jgi:hypothetical protein
MSAKTPPGTSGIDAAKSKALFRWNSHFTTMLLSGNYVLYVPCHWGAFDPMNWCRLLECECIDGRSGALVQES